MRIDLESLEGATFGARMRAAASVSPHDLVAALESRPNQLLELLDQARGLLVLPAMDAVRESPDLLVRLSHLCGSEVENYRKTLTTPNMVHPDIPEILVLSNQPPSLRMPPARPSPALTETGGLPVQFPHRRGWHTDQSFRRPPPDISLFLAVTPCPKGQGHTLFADGAAAYEALEPGLRAQIDKLDGLHALLATGRSEDSVRNGVEPKPLMPHQRSQRQPVARVHPTSGRRAIFLCEAGQMDWLDGPFVGMPPGPEGTGAKLLYELMSHTTSPDFVYAHDWDAGDLLIYDNRCLLHAATWYDAEQHTRIMWRTTESGNPGLEYDGEARSWVPDEGVKPMQGLEDLSGQADVPD